MSRRRGSKKSYYLTLKELYETSGQPPASTRTMLRWAIGRGYEEPPEVDTEGIQAREMARALREELEPDPQGRLVRRNHCCPSEREQADGTIIQEELWGTFDSLTRSQVHTSFQLRRKNIFGDCKQLKTDADSYNDFKNPGKAIQLCFDFSEDIAESEQPTVYEPSEIQSDASLP